MPDPETDLPPQPGFAEPSTDEPTQLDRIEAKIDRLLELLEKKHEHR